MSTKSEEQDGPEPPNQNTSLTTLPTENYQTLVEKGEQVDDVEDGAELPEDIRGEMLEKIELQGYYNVDDAIEYIGLGLLK